MTSPHIRFGSAHGNSTVRARAQIRRAHVEGPEAHDNATVDIDIVEVPDRGEDYKRGTFVGRSWLRVSVWSGVAAGGLAAASLTLGPSWSLAVLVVAAACFVFVLVHNPRYWRRRLVSVLVSVWAVRSVGVYLRFGKVDGDTYIAELRGGGEFLFHVGTVFLVALLLLLDARCPPDGETSSGA